MEMFCTVELFTVTEQVAVLLTATRLGPQVLLVTVTPPGIDGVIPKPLAVWLPGRAFRVMVMVCEWLTSFTPLGAILMLASTQALVAGPELLWEPSVTRLTR